MIVRLTFVSFLPGKAEEAKAIYTDKLAPVVKRQKGNIDCRLLEPVDSSGEFISMTTWDSKGSADAYQASGVYKDLVDQLKKFYAKDPVLRVYNAQDILEHA
jgi:quinol monooxygenase YgiN